MAGTGPAPKPADQRARRNATVAMTKLPAEGRKGRTPAWPLGGDLATETKIFELQQQIKQIEDDAEWETSARERSAQRRRLARANKQIAEAKAMKSHLAKNEKLLWAELWKTPQATQWQKLGWNREVAQYVRHKVKAEGGSLDDAKEARQLSDRLGLSPLALLRLRWEIADPATTSSKTPARRSRRNAGKYGGLKVVS